MRRLIGRATLLSCATLAASLLLCAPGWADQPKTYSIQPQPLASALREFARQSNREILFSSEVVKNKTTAGVSGLISAESALTQLLVGTGLVASIAPSGQILISTAQAPGAPAAREPQGAPHGASSSRDPANQTNTQTPDPIRLDEIVVTAQKREERLQDVPVPVSAVDANSLVSANQLLLRDYYTQFPGLNVTPTVQSQQILSIRGITTGLGNPTVGVTVDDVPYGSSTFNGGGAVIPDIDPSELARIEVLRGPQGTLYGASSMGGLIKFVTLDPAMDAFSGRVQAGMSEVRNGSAPGYNVRASINVPVTDSFAFRASVFHRQDAGYIDNPVLRIEGINEAHANGGLLSALWRPSDALSLKLTALYQDIRGDGSNDVDVPTPGYALPPLAGLQQSYLPGVGAYERKAQSYNATLTSQLGFGELTSVTGYNINSFTDSTDLSYLYSAFGFPAVPVSYDNRTDKLTQELRLSVPFAERFDWLLGGFYTHERSPYTADVIAADPASGATVSIIESVSFPTTYQEAAGFTDLTYHLSDRFDIQAGLRESHIKQTYEQAIGGAITGGVVSSLPQASSAANAFTYLLTPRLRLADDLMIYARLASGYRAGGPNPTPGGVVPKQYDPDKTRNYELGIKADLFARRLSFDASLYYISWSDIQVTLINSAGGTVSSYQANGGRARSEGIELEAQVRPYAGLTVSAWTVFNNSALTENFPANSSVVGTGVDGAQLPYASRFSAHVSAQQDFPVRGDLTGFVGAMVGYEGERDGVFVPTAPRQAYPAYAKTDLRAGLNYRTWTFNLFADNVTDRRGVLNGGIGQNPPFAFTYIQPRTIGASLTKDF